MFPNPVFNFSVYGQDIMFNLMPLLFKCNICNRTGIFVAHLLNDNSNDRNGLRMVVGYTSSIMVSSAQPQCPIVVMLAALPIARVVGTGQRGSFERDLP